MKAKELVSGLNKFGAEDIDIARSIGVSLATVYRWKRNTEPHKTFQKKLISLHRVWKGRYEKEGI